MEQGVLSMDIFFLGTGAGYLPSSEMLHLSPLNCLKSAVQSGCSMQGKPPSIKFYIHRLNQEELKKFLLPTSMAIIFMDYPACYQAVHFKVENLR